ncbi:hypothetical protein [Amycolatopsis suaedae]|uniref:Uncharacterized protein n=1 Tax=Amycolatopsis suaedae TaxID=2510978 RepID=A0A4Q7JB39_9PSEU|nr:hypothetical protein [Amycolatopsis suaedae]RZQ64497.1 hypothetical protein EWH70_06140 [Amycolatopsis suaedae]
MTGSPRSSPRWHPPRVTRHPAARPDDLMSAALRLADCPRMPRDRPLRRPGPLALLVLGHHG